MVVLCFQVTFTLQCVDDDVNTNNVRIEVHGPNSKPPVRMRWNSGQGYGEFVPVEPGPHRVSALTNHAELCLSINVFTTLYMPGHT